MLATIVEWAGIAIRIVFVLGFIVYVFAVMNYAIEHDALRAILALAAAVICVRKI
jgi:hypothetical protein